MHPDAPLPLDGYQRLIALEVPFAPRVVEGRAPDALLRLALEFLEQEDLQREHSHERDNGRRLRALLTARSPEPLPSEVHDAIDSLLHLQRVARPTVDACDLPRFALTQRDGAPFALWQGDITTLAIDAIVNAANAQLLGCFTPFHACIDNAIHAAAGPRLREDCHCIMAAQGFLEPTACAKVTRGYHLPSRFVLHTVGPIVRGVLTGEHRADLARSYRACLDLAAETGLVRSLAFCAISTGVFGFPKETAARIALGTTRDWMREHPGALDLVVFNVFSDGDKETYTHVIEELGA